LSNPELQTLLDCGEATVELLDCGHRDVVPTVEIRTVLYVDVEFVV